MQSGCITGHADMIGTSLFLVRVFPLVFQGLYGFTLEQQGLAFIGIMFGASIAMGPSFYYHQARVVPQFNESGEISREHRLPPAYVGAFLIPICLFLLDCANHCLFIFFHGCLPALHVSFELSWRRISKLYRQRLCGKRFKS